MKLFDFLKFLGTLLAFSMELFNYIKSKNEDPTLRVKEVHDAFSAVLTANTDEDKHNALVKLRSAIR